MHILKEIFLKINKTAYKKSLFIKKALFYINNKIRITYFISIIPIDSIIAEDIYIHMTILVTNFTHVVYSTFEIASPPIITPDVGVIKFTRPLPALNIDITISGANPNVWARGPNIGTDKLASPEVDGIKNAKAIYIKAESIVIKYTVDIIL